MNITSVHEHTPLPDASAYTAAKHALGGLTKSMALELVKHKILVNAVAPGAIATPMNDMDDSEVKEGAMPEIRWHGQGIPKKLPAWWRGCVTATPATPPGSRLSSTAVLCWRIRSLSLRNKHSPHPQGERVYSVWGEGEGEGQQAELTLHPAAFRDA